MKPDPHRLFGLDVAAIALISALICWRSQHLRFMAFAVPLILVLRFALLALLQKPEDGSFLREVVLFLICTALGAFNDWNSVVNHRIYDYTVPTDLSFSSIPSWMLWFWGLILRGFLRLCRWQALNPPPAPDNRVHLGFATVENGWLKISLLLALVLTTRQAIYRLYLDPLWSWAPFALALALYAFFFRLRGRELKLLAIFPLLGPGIEMLFINLGHLHRYHLGWIFGVPLWIVLWWLLAILVWQDLGLRLELRLQRALG